ncbi:Cy209 [Cynomolgus cytomegalovirus]|uniref:Protein US24 n=1 Tax=Cynomolgus macaque cytomegalovirus strain Mauritius TaxID=1690255 RepID=A0A0K1GZN4_9BETA|nr:Cy209 [Cynomolgus cytomegalovirus]AKT72677.1 protein US24 [Cynomolgus macaque cytomegalovirus strain Mauritius]AXG22215.1 protein US24 [synthetic construct]APT39270.1 Cy209 [Cynomolgus cytomegalovirus]APT39557.1 Cy209 [Cynomolgus cytomegalovirus]APT39654.1 Cy209 [Cynomolgus cytomegalovirus]
MAEFSDRPVDELQFYRQVLIDFRDLFFCLDAPQIEHYVWRYRGRRLCLGPPQGWYVELQRDQQLVQAQHAARKLICCNEPLCALGYALKLIPEPHRDHERDYLQTDFVICMGRFCRIYAFDPRENYMVLVAHHLEELAKYGVLRSEFIYRDSVHNQLRRLSPTLIRSGPRSIRTMHILFLNETTPDSFYVTADRILDHDVKLHTPGYGTVIMRLMKTVTELRTVWPFSSLTETEAKRWWWGIRANLATPWYLLGVTGRPRLGRSFVAEVMVVLDWFGAVYAIQLDEPNHNLRRVANTLTEFFRMGLLKLVFAYRRFEPERQRKIRMEHQCICPHVEEREMDRRHELLAPFEREERRQRFVQQHYDWLCLTERFDPRQGAWERLDPNVLVLHRYDTVQQTYVLESDIVGVEAAEREAASHQEDTGPRLHCLVTTKSSTRERTTERVLAALVYQSRLVTYTDPFPFKSLTGSREFVPI